MSEFASVYEQERPVVFAYLLKVTRDWHLAEDLTSQTFLAAWEALDRWQDRGIPYRHYLLRIAHWQHGLHWKKEKRWQRRMHHNRYLTQHVESVDALMTDGGIDAVLDWVNNAVAYAFLEAALRKMRPRPLRALALRYGVGLSEIEAGRRMGLGRDAYRAVRRGAIERLQQIMLGKEPRWTAKNAKRRAYAVERPVSCDQLHTSSFGL